MQVSFLLKSTLAELLSVQNKGFFKGAKTGEGKTPTGKTRSLQKGDVIRMACTERKAYLGLEEGDSFLVTIVGVTE